MIESRFSDAVWFKLARQQSIIVGGTGGIGSWLTLFLARLGTSRIVLYDSDRFEEHNVGGQFVPREDIGMKKVTSVKNNVYKFTNSRGIITYDKKYGPGSMVSSTVFSCFDNMKARKAMFNNWLNYNSDTGIFIDGRLNMELMQIFCVDKSNTEDIAKYTDFLFDDSEVEDAVCTLKQTSHSAAMIASMMTAFYTNWLANVASKNNARRVPFSTEYFIPLNLLEDVRE